MQGYDEEGNDELIEAWMWIWRLVCAKPDLLPVIESSRVYFDPTLKVLYVSNVFLGLPQAREKLKSLLEALFHWTFFFTDSMGWDFSMSC